MIEGVARELAGSGNQFRLVHQAEAQLDRQLAHLLPSYHYVIRILQRQLLTLQHCHSLFLVATNSR